MARTRNSGGAASTWALVIFGFGFVASLLLAIVLFTRLSAQQQQADEARQQLDQFVSARERNDPEVRSLVQAGGDSVVGELLQRNLQLRALISSNQELDAEALQQQLAQANIDPPLVSTVETLRAELAAREARIDQLQQDMNQALARAQTAEQEMNQLKQQYDESVNSLEQQLASATSAFQAYQQQVDDMAAQLTQQVTQVRQEREQQLGEMQTQADRLQQEAATLRQRLLNATGGAAGVQAPEIIQPDARIMSVTDNGGRIYLNRGRKDRLVLGTTFEVFPSSAAVKPEESDELRGKATVEVIEVGENSSIARVVRRERGRLVQEGDQLINLAYDPNATYTFMVFGEFDIDNTGEPTTADRQRIEGMINRWGADLADDLSYEVDFLVLGNEPPQPDPLPRDVIDPQRLREHAQAQREFEQYQALEEQARSMSIPVLNQNRFLALVGYYQR